MHLYVCTDLVRLTQFELPQALSTALGQSALIFPHETPAIVSERPCLPFIHSLESLNMSKLISELLFF